MLAGSELMGSDRVRLRLRVDGNLAAQGAMFQLPRVRKLWKTQNSLAIGQQLG